MLRQNKMDEIIKFNEDNCGEIRKIEFIKYIASGDFGDIFMGIYKEEYVAIKIIPYYEDDYIMEMLNYNEIIIGIETGKLFDRKITDNFTQIYYWNKCLLSDKRLNNIYKLTDNIMHKKQNNIYIVMELMENNMDNYKFNSVLEFKSIILQLLYGLLCGIKYLSISIIDISPRNILIKKVDYDKVYHVGNNNYFIPNYFPTVKFSDFGLSEIRTESSTDVFYLYISILEIFNNNNIESIMNDQDFSQFQLFLNYLSHNNKYSHSDSYNILLTVLNMSFFSIFNTLSYPLNSVHFYS